MWKLAIVGCLLFTCACDWLFGISSFTASDAHPRAITYQQSKSKFGNGSDSLTVTFDKPVQVGDLVVVAIATFDAIFGDASDVTDSAQSMYHRAGLVGEERRTGPCSTYSTRRISRSRARSA